MRILIVGNVIKDVYLGLDERKDNFRKLFDVIDDALAKNNIQQLQLGLSSMNHLAALSPFKSLESIESTQKALGDKDHTWNF